MFSRSNRRILCTGIAASIALCLPRAQAATETVNPGMDGVWNTGSNWADGSAPATGGTLSNIRLNVNGLIIYDFPGVTTTFDVSPAGGEARPLGIGSGSNVDGVLEVNAGTLIFKTEAGNTQGQGAFITAALDNTARSSGLLHVNGGDVIVNGPTSLLIVMGRGNAASTGTVTIDSGSLTVDRIDFGSISAGVVGTGTINLNGGTLNTKSIASSSVTTVVNLNLNGGTVATSGAALAGFDLIGANIDSATLGGNVNFDTTLGSGVISATLTGTGGITKIGNGTLSITSATSYTGATLVNAGTLSTTTAQTGTSSVTVADGATLALMRTGSGASFSTGALTLGSSAGATLQINVGTAGFDSANALINAASFSASNGTAIQITGGAIASGLFPLIDYTGTIGGAGFGGLSITFPGAPRATGSLVNNTVDQRVDVNITNESIKWIGNLSADWDIDDSATTGTIEGTQNWRTETTNVATNYLQGTASRDSVIFDDAATGPRNINLTTALTPTGIVVNNTSASGDYIFSGLGSIGGGANFTKNNTGTITLANTGANTYTGTTTINGGKVQVGDGVTTGAGSLGSGPIVITGGTLEANRPEGLTLANVISGTAGTIALGAGNLTLTGTGSNFSGAVTLGDAARVLTLANTISLGGAISGDGGLAINSQGGKIVTLSGNNSYTGLTTISLNSHLLISTSTALGSASQGTTNTGGGSTGDTDVNGSSVQLSGNITVAGEPLTISGSGGSATGVTAQRGALQSVSGDNTWGGPVTLASNLTRIGVQDGASLTVSGTISDGGAGYDVIFRGGTNTAGSITLSGTGNQWGTTRIYGSSIRIDGGDDILPVAAPLFLGTTGVGTSVLDLNGHNQQVRGIGQIVATAAVITNEGAADSTLTIDGAVDMTFGGTLVDGATHKLSLTKRGPSVQTLNGLNSYTGVTNIEEGTLALGATGSLFATSAIRIASGATLDVLAGGGGLGLPGTQTLEGSGSVLGSIFASGGSTISPGLGAGNAGALSISNDLTLDVDAHLKLELIGSASYDQVLVGNGNISLAGDLSGSVINFAPTNFADVFYIIINNGFGITTGTLDGVAEGGSIFIGAQEFQISYTSDFGGAGFQVGGLGNDVALLAVPEPSSAVLLAGGLCAVLGLRRRRFAPAS